MSAQPSVTPGILDVAESGIFPHAARIANFSRRAAKREAIPTERLGYNIGKRAIDLICAALLAPLAAVIMAGISLAIWLTSDGPVFFRHERIGRNGRPFSIWKFRTMHQDSDRILREHLKRDADARAEWHESLKLRNDPRVTALGKILRETSLDEVPQILNILRGEMSFVGPRPIVAAEMVRYGDRLPYYLAATPGVTGLWQISGRCNISYESRVILDETYVQHWTIGGDLWILLHTPQAVFRKDGAC